MAQSKCFATEGPQQKQRHSVHYRPEYLSLFVSENSDPGRERF